jgi:hypothetical protein
MQYTSFAAESPSFAEESPSFTEELPSFLTTPVRPVQQQEEEAATVIDSCNPLTFLYNSQCINISLSWRLLGKQSKIFLIFEYGRGGLCLKNLCLVC